MNKKRSRGVIVLGLLLSAYGFLTFVGNIISSLAAFHNEAFLTKALSFGARFFAVFRNAGMPLTEIGGLLSGITRMVYREYPFLAIVSFVIIPTIGFIVFLGGIGILRLKESWRKGSMAAYALLLCTVFCSRIYVGLYMVYVFMVGKIINSQGPELVLGIKGLMRSGSAMLVKDFIGHAFLLSLLVFFLTRPKVKAQFA
ncbi:MAG: hypothetical protein KBC23_06475 [Candidatus Omnitrophica bacterium]|nr:hypothetical protein [Candidatus Omnitrophota bacterium]